MADIVKTQTPVPQNNLPSGPASPVPVVIDALENLAKEINKHFGNINSMGRVVLEDAMNAGDLLKQAKAAVGHGNWKQWLDENCKLSERTARRYMALADDRKIIEAGLNNKTTKLADFITTIQQAEKLITKSKALPGPNGSADGKAKPNALTELVSADTGVGNDPLQTVTSASIKLVNALENLAYNDANKAKEAAVAIVNQLKGKFHIA